MPSVDYRKQHAKRRIAEENVSKTAEKLVTESRDKLRPKQNFKCAIRFRNALPELPFHPKFLRTEKDMASTMELVKYKRTSLEKSYTFGTQLKPGFGPDMQVINAVKSHKVGKATIPDIEKDRALLRMCKQERSSAGLANKNDGASSIVEKRTWLRKTMYLHVEEAKPKPKKDSMDDDEAITEEDQARDVFSSKKKSLLETIVSSFDATNMENSNNISNLRHPSKDASKRKLRATEIIPFVPDTSLMTQDYFVANFSSIKEEDVALRGVLCQYEGNDSEQDQYVLSHLVPKADLGEEEKKSGDGSSMEWCRNYEFEVVENKRQSLMVVFDSSGNKPSKATFLKLQPSSINLKRKIMPEMLRTVLKKKKCRVIRRDLDIDEESQRKTKLYALSEVHSSAAAIPESTSVNISSSSPVQAQRKSTADRDESGVEGKTNDAEADIWGSDSDSD